MLKLLRVGRGVSRVSAHDIEEHFGDFLSKEGYRPGEEVNVSREMKGMLDILILLDVHFVIFNQYHCSLVIVDAAVVGSTEHGNN
jgi:hypothetical protein